MLLANVVLMAQMAANTPAREVNRPCADQSALCRISPFFCPGTYPQGLEPCWPEGSRQPRNVGGRGGSHPQTAPAATSRSVPQRSREARNAKVRQLTAD
jgi:hypothetical protein